MWRCVHFSPPGFFSWLRQEQPRLSPYASRGTSSTDARHAAVGESAERPCFPRHRPRLSKKKAPAFCSITSLNAGCERTEVRMTRCGSILREKWWESGTKRRRRGREPRLVGDLKGTDGPPGSAAAPAFSPAKKAFVLNPQRTLGASARTEQTQPATGTLHTFISPGCDTGNDRWKVARR